MIPVYVLGALLALAPLAAWNWRSLALIVLIVAAPLYLLVADHELHALDPNFDPGFGYLMVVPAIWGVQIFGAAFTVVRALSLTATTLGWSPTRARRIDLGAVVLALASLVGLFWSVSHDRPQAWMACAEPTLTVSLGGEIFHVPLTAPFRIHEGANAARDLGNAGHIQAICARALAGEVVPVTNVTLSTHHWHHHRQQQACPVLPSAWGALLCSDAQPDISLTLVAGAARHPKPWANLDIRHDRDFTESRAAHPWKANAYQSFVSDRVRRFADDYLHDRQTGAVARCREQARRFSCDLDAATAAGSAVRWAFAAAEADLGRAFVTAQAERDHVLDLLRRPPPPR